MVRDTRSAGKVINAVDDTTSKKKINGEKDMAECSSGKADTPGRRRSSRDTSSSGLSIPSTQSLCKLKHPERGTSPSASPGVRKSGRLENRNTPSSLGKSDGGKNSISSTSSHKLSGKVLSFSGERRKKEKNIQAVIMESGKVRVEVESVGRKRKKMTGHAFRKRFKMHRPVDRVPDSAEAIERLENLCEDATTIDNVVDEIPDGNGSKDSHTIKNLDPVDSESSTSLGQSRDCDVLPDCGLKCTHPEDVDSAMDGPEKLSASSPIIENDGHEPPMRNILKDSRSGLEPISSTCSANSEDSPVNVGDGPVATPPTPESENCGLSVLCVLCSKRKRISVDSPENELCSCGTPPREIICGLRASEDRGYRGTAATLESPATLGYAERDLARESYSDNHEMNSQVYACVNCSDPLCCGGCKGSKRCSPLIANEENSRFLEYWLPVQISNHQLEQYCATLLSNSIPLRSCSKNDNCGALQETLRTVKKCCAHPYLVDSSPQDRFIAEGHLAKEVLDIGVEASGKLQLLDRMIAKIKDSGSRVLIVFQLIVGSGKASTGDILDDFLRQRFGENTYERVQASVTSSKKQAAVNRFNSKEPGKFIFLLENRACSATIKLLSLDNIIIFNSDWNPVNDLRALQKISIDSGVEKIKVFRLYSSFTFEERALFLAKKNVDIENSLQTLSRARIDSLLMWGATYLFSKLEEYHAESTSALYVPSGKLLLTDVMREFQSILSENYENRGSTSIISEVKLDGGGYKTNNKLLGEVNVEVKEEVEEAHVFWKNILDRKIPQWKHIEAPSSRTRKRVQYFDSPPGKQYVRDDDAGKKRKRVGNGTADLVFVQADIDVLQETRLAGSYEGTSTQTPSLDKTAVTSNNNVDDEQKSSHSFLEGEIMKLCHILKFTEDVTHTVKRFLEYIIKNHHISSNQPEIVESFQISLCWTASSMMKQKVDRGISLELARQALSYQCTEEQALSVYSKLRPLKKMYLQWLGNSIDSVGKSLLAEEDTGEPSNTSSKTEVEFLLDQKKAISELDGNETRIQPEKFCHKQLKKLRREHKKKIQEFYEIWDAKRQKLVEDHKLDAAFIRSLHDEGSVRTEKLKHCDNAFAKKIEEHNLLREAELEALKAEQLVARNEAKRSAACWLAGAKICLDELNVPNGALLVSSNQVDEPVCSLTDKNTLINTANDALMSNQHEENENATKSISTQGINVSPPNISVGPPTNAVECNDTIETSSSLVSTGVRNEVAEPLNKEVPEEAPETVPVENVLQDREQQSSVEPHEKNVLTVGNEQISDTEVSASAFSKSVTATVSNVHIEDQDTPAVEKQSSVQATNPEHADIVNPAQSGVTAQVGTVTSAESPPINELQHKDAPTMENQTPLLIDPPVVPIMEQPVQDSAAVENRSAPLGEWNIVPDQVSGEVFPSCHQIAELPNQAVLPLEVGSSYLPGPTTQQAAFHLGQAFLSEPLQFEFEHLSKEKEYLNKSHEDTASKMKSDCDKEIEKAIQEIRMKYDVKLREAELEFKLKKKALDRNQNKVLMNRNLAQSFRSKCSDGRSASNGRIVQQGFNRHSHSPQVRQQSVQPLARPPQSHQQPHLRHSIWSSNFQMSSRPSEQSHMPHQQALLHHPVRPPPTSNVGSVIHPAVQIVPPQQQALLHHPVRPPPISNGAPVVHPAVHTPPPPRFSSTPPSRPLVISSHTPLGNPSNSGNIRAPPPHLQRSRSAAAGVSAPPHLQVGPQIQQTSLPESSEAFGGLPNSSSRQEGGFPVHLSLNHSAIESLMNIDQQSKLQVLGSNVGDANHPTTWGVAEKNGVVCLSDDE